MSRIKLLWQVFWTFFKVGLFTFGGGYTILPILQREVVDKRNWAKEEDVIDYYALAQCEPGLIAVNIAILISVTRFGKKAAVPAALGVVTPSIVIILIVSGLLKSYGDLAVVQHAFAGIKVAIAALVAQAVIRMAKKGVIDFFSAIIFIAAALLLFFDLVNSVLIVLGAAGLGILWSRFGPKRSQPTPKTQGGADK